MDPDIIVHLAHIRIWSLLTLGTNKDFTTISTLSN